VHKGRFVTINIAEYNADDTFARLRVVASANRRESFTVSSTIDLAPDSSWGVLYRSIESNEPAVINHIKEDENISQDVRDWLAGFGIKSVFSLPLRHHDHTYGFLGINDTRGAIILSAEEMRVYQQLADQLSALIQIHNLVEESTYVSEISEHQARAFAELRTGQDFVEMAGIIGRHMLQVPGRLLSLNKLIYNGQGHLEHWQTVATANRDHARAWEGEQVIDLDAFGPKLIQSVQDGVPYVINDANTITPEEIGDGFYNWIKKYQFRTLLNVPVMVNQTPVACLCVFGTSRRPFSTAEVNALNNLCDQIGILIHTNDLLQEAEAARSQANDIVLASRLIKIAEDYDDMAQAVIYTLGKGLTAAGLVLFDQALGGSSRPGYRSLITLVTAEGADETDSTMPFDRLPEPAQLDSLMNGLPIITADLYADTSY
ncbi:MAG: GAF domain-containing protein, partial [Anaerolineae bacterium]|nr:GAF domain-containing protein [Anaerolineae bacterium]